MFHSFKNGLVLFGYVFKYQNSFENKREKKIFKIKTLTTNQASPLFPGLFPLLNRSSLTPAAHPGGLLLFPTARPTFPTLARVQPIFF
jgi:hypothetical protein